MIKVNKRVKAIPKTQADHGEVDIGFAHGTGPDSGKSDPWSHLGN
jgi:hypothetical protein